MAIRVKHGRPSTIITAARRAGEARAAQRASEQAMAAATRLREKQMDIEYRTALRQQDMAIDLQMNERAKLWEIQKMELHSQTDFAREEQKRQRALDEMDASIRAIKESDLFDKGSPRQELAILNVRLKAMDSAQISESEAGIDTEPVQKVPTPTQRVSAMKKLREEEVFQEPTWLQAWLPGGKGELSEDVLREKELLESIAAGQYVPPAGIITPGLPTPTTQAEYDRIPRGSQYIDRVGNKRTKS